MITWNEWINRACLKLSGSFCCKRDVEFLLLTVVNKSRAQLFAFGETLLKYDQLIQLNKLIDRRKQGEPIDYLIGSKEFWSLNFKVSSGAFIPRSDTECLVEKVLNLLPNSYLTVLDLGTGVGTIALSLASERTYWNILGIDLQKHALKLAQQNKLLFNYQNVKFIYGNWFTYLQGKKFDLIVSNPPYINENDPCWLINNNINYEPKNALISSNMGLSDLTEICKNSIYHLNKNGWLFLEHGWNQGQDVRNLFYKFKFSNIYTIFDYHCCERVTYGQWNP